MTVRTPTFPSLKPASLLSAGCDRVYIGAFGCEDRALGWCQSQARLSNVVSSAILFKYINPKGKNRVDELKSTLRRLGARDIKAVDYNTWRPQPLEDKLSDVFGSLGCSEVIVDISAMTKLLILLVLSKLVKYTGSVRVVYSEARQYPPNERQFNSWRNKKTAIARFPSQGAEQVIRLNCLNSIRMQGQPIALVAFTSFNEKLVNLMLGSVSPHRLFLINGRPPHPDFAWREHATQLIHEQLCNEYEVDNPRDNAGLLQRQSSTLYYEETVKCFDEVYGRHGQHERIVCGATGSKMQTVGLFLCKVRHPDIQIEYPTPDSYFFPGMPKGVLRVHEVVLDPFKGSIEEMR